MAALTIPPAFSTLQSDPPGELPIRVRERLDENAAAEIVKAIRAVSWNELFHAYGPAGDVAAQLIAATVGDDPTRDAAWWNLWGNIHHQGTIYEATVPAAPVIARLAAWDTYPDRIQAICFLREIAAAEGVVVWRRDGDEMVFDDERQQSLTSDLGRDARALSVSLLQTWRSERPELRRALLWLLSALPDLHDQFRDLVEAVLPASQRTGWSVLSRVPESQEEFDRVCEFEEWALARTG
jgi:hypothetical protein